MRVQTSDSGLLRPTVHYPWHGVRVGKKASKQTVIGEQGVALVFEMVSAMGHLWHPTSGADSGIDGEIELRDVETSTVRNVRIGVQSRATTRRWVGESDQSFTYRPTPDELEYWLSSNQPVLLVCSRPNDNEAYWRSVQEWAQDPKARAGGVIRFDKARDRFDASTGGQLFDLRASATDRVEPPGPVQVPETILTNLMPIDWQADVLHSVSVDAPRKLPGRVALRGGRAWALEPFAERDLATLRASDPQEHVLGNWLGSDERDDTNLVRELVRRTLVAQRSRWILWREGREIAYFRCKETGWNSVHYARTRGKGRAVVTPQKAKTREGYTGFRHDAAHIVVRRLDGRWYVQITPTYLFTWDGRKISGHHASALKGIKKLDKHATVSQMLRLWEHLLVERLTMDDELDRDAFLLGELASVRVPVSIDQKAWQRILPSDVMGEDARQGSLFDSPDKPA